MVTCGVYGKAHLLHTPERLTLVLETLFGVAEAFLWRLQAWAVLCNHYHFVALAPSDAQSLPKMLSKLHAVTARELNRIDDAQGRRVWHQYWDSHITYEKSYIARLKYVHQNPMHHGVVDCPTKYAWCSAAWFERNARPAMQRVLESFKIDQVSVADDF